MPGPTPSTASASSASCSAAPATCTAKLAAAVFSDESVALQLTVVMPIRDAAGRWCAVQDGIWPLSSVAVTV